MKLARSVNSMSLLMRWLKVILPSLPQLTILPTLPNGIFTSPTKSGTCLRSWKIPSRVSRKKSITNSNLSNNLPSRPTSNFFAFSHSRLSAPIEFSQIPPLVYFQFVVAEPFTFMLVRYGKRLSVIRSLPTKPYEARILK